MRRKFLLMLFVVFNCTVAANAQQELQVYDLADTTQPLILYGEEASEAWGNLVEFSSSYPEYEYVEEKKFYGSDIVITVPAEAAGILAHIPPEMAEALGRDGTAITVPAEEAAGMILAHIPPEMAEALGRDGTAITVPAEEAAGMILAHIPPEMAEALDRDGTAIKLPMIKIFWSCSTPDPNFFWEQFLIRSKEEVVTCLWDLQGPERSDTR